MLQKNFGVVRKMTYGIRFEQKDILVVPFPFSDLSGIKQRPVLVISNNIYNKMSNDIVTCGITSNLRILRHSIAIDNKNLEKGKIPVKSLIKTDKIFTLEKQIVRKRIARVDDETFEKVKSELAKLFNIQSKM